MSRIYSIRDFCHLETPKLMFDKDGSFVIMKLGQVCILPELGKKIYADVIHSYFQHLSAQRPFPLWRLFQQQVDLAWNRLLVQ